MAEVYDISRIKSLLPYEYPMLMVDRFCRESDTKFVGLKNLTFNEEFFQGHFPVNPIFPGVLQVEAMKQVAQLGLADVIDPSGENDIYVKSMKRVKFRRPNNPGDRVRIDVEVREVTGNEASVKASVTNNSGLACQANLVLAARPKVAADRMPEMFTEFDKKENINMDINQIKIHVPHRYPFLFIDYIVKIEDNHICAVKNISYNEPFFRGYKGDYPVLPGSFQSEIIAQAGCAFILSQPKNVGKIAYFASIDCDFIRPVRPGDQLVINVDVEDQSKLGRGGGVMTVDGEKVLGMEMKFALVDPEND